MDISENILDFDVAVSYISSIPHFADTNDFVNMRAFYHYMNDRFSLEDSRKKVFHVAGTNGKGSTCAYLASMHKAMGKRTGVFTSPHLTDIRERIVVDGDYVTEEVFFKAFKIVSEVLKSFRENSEYKNYVPTYFTWLFFIAAIVFKEENTDVIIWETGLGGRLDATNVIINKNVSIITEIGFDHMEYLGNTLKEIAGEKAGIIKSGIPVIAVDRENEATGVIKTYAKKQNATFNFVKIPEKINLREDGTGIDFYYKSRYYNNAIFGINTIATYQCENASIALAAMEVVYTEDELSLDMMRKGLLNMKWQGRMEEIDKGIILDGAHNIDGIAALLETVKSISCTGKKLLLFSAVADKQADKMLNMICASKEFDVIALTHIDNYRGIDIASLKKLGEQFGHLEVYEDVFAAYTRLKSSMQSGDYLFVCGSLYLIGELKWRILKDD